MKTPGNLSPYFALWATKGSGWRLPYEANCGCNCVVWGLIHFFKKRLAAAAMFPEIEQGEIVGVFL